MNGISSSGKTEIGKVVEDIFDRIALQMVGSIPRLAHKKMLILSAKPNFNLAHLFVQALGNKTPNVLESDALKGMLDATIGYLESLKAKTRATVTEQLDGLIRDAEARGEKVGEAEVEVLLKEQFGKARNALRTIAEAESNKVKSVGVMMDISKISATAGEADPAVFWVCVHDDKLCPECRRLHLMPDGVTPRVWRFSEVGHGYHKRGDAAPSIVGLHPGDRCVLTYLARGFGFKNGRVGYIREGHDEYRRQRE
jgi:hypothetical protein